MKGSLALFIFAAAAIAAAQAQAVNPVQTGTSTTTTPPQLYTGVDATIPVLVAPQFALRDANTCTKLVQGSVIFSFYVTADGKPVNPGFLQATGDGLDKLAQTILDIDTFHPSLLNGTAVPVPQTIEIRMEGCSELTKDPNDRQKQLLWLTAEPVQTLRAWKVDPGDVPYALYSPHNEAAKNSLPTLRQPDPKAGVPWPTPIHMVDPRFPPETNDKLINGNVILSLIVDVDGMPRDIRVVRPAGYGMEIEAIKAARQYRFKPATFHGEPLPVFINLELNFRRL